MKTLYMCSLYCAGKLLGVLEFEEEETRDKFLEKYFDFMGKEKISYILGTRQVFEQKLAVETFDLDEMPIE